MSLTKVSYSMITGAPVNILDYGFATSASAATNKTAFLAAVAAAGEGGQVVIPQGTYNIDGEIQIIKKGVTIQGAASNYRYSADAGFTGTKLVFTSGTSGIDLTQLDSDGATSSEYTVLRNLNIDGNSILQNGVFIKGCKVLDNCTLTGCLTAGLRLGGLVNSTVIKQCGIVGNNGVSSRGVFMDGVGNTVLKVVECNIRQNTIGIEINQGTGWEFTDCVIESNTGKATYINVTAGLRVGNGVFNRCWHENNNVAGLDYQVHFTGVDASPDLNYITYYNCHFDALSNTSYKDVYIQKGGFVQFYTCQFSASYGASNTILLAAGCTYAYFFNCGRGAVVGQIERNIQDNGSYTQVSNNPTTNTRGLWVPSVGGTATYTANRYGTWMRIGKQVMVSFDMEINVIGTGSTNSLIDLPFVVQGYDAINLVQTYGTVGYYTNLLTTVYSISCYAEFGTNKLRFNTQSALADTNSKTTAIFKSGSRIQGTITYITSESPEV
jgi:hypothetical protein